jgi:hypothetical protein
MRIFVPIRVAPFIADSLKIKPDIIKPTSNTEAIQRVIDLIKTSNGKLLVLTGAGEKKIFLQVFSTFKKNPSRYSCLLKFFFY